jgi:hypothetical protein
LIPLVGYLIIFNDYVVGCMALAKEFGDGGVSPGMTVPIRLLAIYFGLCALALGSLLYSFGCPDEVKRFPSSAAYVVGEGSTIGQYAIEDIEEALRSAHPTLYKRIRARFDYSVETLRLANSDEMTDRQKQAQTAFLHQYFGVLDARYPWARLATLISFVAGFVLLLVPSVQVFLKVASILTRWAST